MYRMPKILAAVGACAVLCMANTALAQSAGAGSQPEWGGQRAPGNPSDARTVPSNRDTSASRLSTNRRARQAEVVRNPQDVLAEARGLLTAANLSCNPTEAIQPGQSGGSAMYEVACDGSSGYLLIASTPPQSFDCLELAGTAAQARSADPQAQVGQQCTLPANQDALGIIGAWARQAGATCNIDQAQAVGRNGATLVYEVGCADAEGYWLERANNGFTLTPCLQITAQGATCRFTTAAEIATSFQSRLSGTEASGCQVTEVRMMGENPNGRFYEAKCAAGNGLIARVNDAAVQQIYPCETAQRIGGGCTLTQVAAAPAPTEQN